MESRERFINESVAEKEVIKNEAFNHKESKKGNTRNEEG